VFFFAIWASSLLLFKTAMRLKNHERKAGQISYPIITENLLVDNPLTRAWTALRFRARMPRCFLRTGLPQPGNLSYNDIMGKVHI
jgi:hypothetical protein